MMGAAQMCIKGALRSGVGLVKSILPSNLYPILANNIPQAVFMPYTSTDTIEMLKKVWIKQTPLLPDVV